MGYIIQHFSNESIVDFLNINFIFETHSHKFFLKKMAPLICTQNTLSHIDYGIPLLASRSTDYRTSTGKNHRFIPSIPNNFDCRVKTTIKPELLTKDVAIRDESKSTYVTEYQEKPNDRNILQCSSGAKLCWNVNYIKNAQEKIFMDPPPRRASKISEMKDSYQFRQWYPSRDQFIDFKCEMPETFRAIQPNIHPGGKGYYKLLDIYLTENKAKLIPYTPEQLDKAQEDLITIYNANGAHKGLKEELPGKLRGNTNMYDRNLFKVEYPCRFLSRAPKRVPNYGMMSEYRSKYPNPGCSDFYPYLNENGEYFRDSLAGSGPWQDLCPPAMYCTENCHIGTGWPVRAVVDVNCEGKTYIHSPCPVAIKCNEKCLI